MKMSSSVSSAKEKLRRGLSKRLSSTGPTKSVKRFSSCPAESSSCLYLKVTEDCKGHCLTEEESGILKYIKNTHPAFGQQNS